MTSGTEPNAKAPPKSKRAEKAERVKAPPPPGGIADVYRAALPASITIEAEQTKWDVALTVPAPQLRETLQVSREHPQLQMDLLRNQTAVDWTDQGLEVVYHLYSTALRHSITIKTWVPSEKPSLPTVSDLWRMADWAERECREMFGIEFEGHPDPRNLLLDEDFDLPVLRKSHPLAPMEVKQGVDVEYFTREHPRETPSVQKEDGEADDERAQRIAAAKEKAAAAPAEKKPMQELTPEELAEKKAVQAERVKKARALAAAAREAKAGGGAPVAAKPAASAAPVEAKPAAPPPAPATPPSSEKKAATDLSPEELAEKKAAQAERVKRARELAAKARAEKAKRGG